MPDDHDERLTILERAQLLHDATLRRHGDILDHQEDSLTHHAARLALLEGLMAEQTRILTVLTEVSARLETTLHAIKDLLDRGNGH
jgi:hypothetical protein